MELITQIINFIYWYLKPLVKWFLRKTTRLCELQRVCYGELTGAPRTLAVGMYRAPIFDVLILPPTSNILSIILESKIYNIFFFLVSCICLSEWLNIINKDYPETFYNWADMGTLNTRRKCQFLIWDLSYETHNFSIFCQSWVPNLILDSSQQRNTKNYVRHLDFTGHFICSNGE